jgi:hypothetical protein
MPLKPESFRDSSFAAAVSPALTRRSLVKAKGQVIVVHQTRVSKR